MPIYASLAASTSARVAQSSAITRRSRRPELNVRPGSYREVVDEYTLPEVLWPSRQYEVTVTLPRPEDEDVLRPPNGQATAELAAAMVAANGLLTAWTSRKAVLSMVVTSRCQADALSAGVEVARALGAERGACVEVEPLHT